MSRRRAHANGDARKPRGPGLLTRLFTTLVSLAAVAAAAGLGGYYWLKREFDQPGPSAEELVLTVPRGAGAISIAELLEREGAISSALVFRLMARIEGGERELKAGEFAVPAGASMRSVYDQIREGRVLDYPLTFAEGLTSAAIAARLNAADILSGEPISAPPEGSVLPETYRVTRAAPRAELLAQMAQAQSELLDTLWDARAEDLPFDTREEAIILASIVEKETGVASERPRVAAVFINRLSTPGWRLQSDPTIIYGISGGEPLTNAAGVRRGLRRSELDNASNLYNTYHHDGLTPGPICNPGRDSIAAVLNPPDTNEYYFVADGTGGHAFAETSAEHEANVRRWRQIERERRAGGG